MSNFDDHYAQHLSEASSALQVGVRTVHDFLAARGHEELLEELYVAALEADGQYWNVGVGVSNLATITVTVEEGEGGAGALIRDITRVAQKFPMLRTTLSLTRHQLQWLWDTIMGEEPARGRALDRFEVEAAIDELENWRGVTDDVR